MRTLSLLIKPASARCNMRCRYCFYADVSDIRQVKDCGLMNLGMLEQLIERALSEVTEHCLIAFQGGEPTIIGLDYFRALVAFERQYNTRGIKIQHALQTNGTLIDEEWADFLAKNKFLTGISIDGEKALHDEFRPDAQGKGTHSRSMKATRLLKKAGADFNILTVVTRRLAAHPGKAYRFYKREGFRHLQFIPCLDGLEETHGQNPHSLDAESYGSFLCHIFDLWYKDYINGDYVSIRTFDNYIHILAGFPPESCAMAGRCSVNAVVEADGSVYPCDFYAVDEYLLGNIANHGFTEMYQCENAKRFVTESVELPSECTQCRHRAICRGGCRRDCTPFIDGKRRTNVYCKSYKVFFDHALPRIIQIANRFK